MTQERENFELIKKLDVAFTAYILKRVDNYIRLVNSSSKQKAIFTGFIAAIKYSLISCANLNFVW